MIRHRWKILIGVALVFVLLTGIELSTIGNGPKKEVEAYKKSLIAKGEKLEISELIPPPIPPEQNGADIVKQALGMLTPEDREDSNSIPAMQLVGPGKAIICFEQPDVRGRRFTNSWANELAVVAGDRPMTELLRQAIKYPALDFHVDYEAMYEEARVMNSTPLHGAVDRLSAEAMCDLHRGDTASAATNICAILCLINGLQNQRFMILQWMRSFTLSTAANTTWELLQSGSLSDSELAVLQDNWERLEFIHATENAISMQRAMDESEILKMRTSDEYFNKRTSFVTPFDVRWSWGLQYGFNDIRDNARLIVSKSMYHSSWIYSDELRMLRDDQITLEMIRVVETNGFFYPAASNMTSQLKAWADEPDDWLVKLDDWDLHRLFSMRTGHGGLGNQIMDSEARRRIVVTAIALKRYELKHGKYPTMLSDLAPAFISSVPLDPVDGKPLRYRLAGGNFLLYSVGENGKDDGGNASSKSKWGYNPWDWIASDSLDWVWPQPATAAEIQYFYTHKRP